MRRPTWLNWIELGLGLVPATLMTAMLTIFFLLGAIIGVLPTLVIAVLAVPEGSAGGALAALAGSVIFLLTLVWPWSDSWR